MRLISAFMPHLSECSVETKATSRLMFGFTAFVFIYCSSPPPFLSLPACCCLHTVAGLWVCTTLTVHIRVCVRIIKPASSLRSFRGKEAPLQPLLGEDSLCPPPSMRQIPLKNFTCCLFGVSGHVWTFVSMYVVDKRTHLRCFLISFYYLEILEIKLEMTPKPSK